MKHEVWTAVDVYPVGLWRDLRDYARGRHVPRAYRPRALARLLRCRPGRDTKCRASCGVPAGGQGRAGDTGQPAPATRCARGVQLVGHAVTTLCANPGGIPWAGELLCWPCTGRQCGQIAGDLSQTYGPPVTVARTRR